MYVHFTKRLFSKFQQVVANKTLMQHNSTRHLRPELMISGLFTVALSLIVLLADGTTLVKTIALSGFSVSFFAWARQVRATQSLKFRLRKIEQKLASESSASRVLEAIKGLNDAKDISLGQKLVTAARLSTGYPAAVFFTLRDSQGMFVPTQWNYPFQIDFKRESFEPLDSKLAGAYSAQLGAPLVISETSNGNYVLPKWIAASEFKSAIVAPVSHGLNTLAVIYVLKMSEDLPTLKEIEQLELVIDYATNNSNQLSETGITYSSVNLQSPRELPFSSKGVNSARPIEIQGFRLEPEFSRLDMSGTSLSLSPTEFSLVYQLASSPKKPVPTEILMDRCWNKQSRPADNAVDVAISRLRKKLRKLDSGQDIIKTVRGIGYMFMPPKREQHTTNDSSKTTSTY